MKTHFVLNLYILLSIGFNLSTTGLWAAENPPAPIHPDTLPTLMESWSLPASLAPEVTNTYAPRMMVKDPNLFVFDHNGRRLVALNPDNGTIRWHRPIKSRTNAAFSFTPLVYRNSVYVASDGFLYSFNTATGKMKWQISTGGVAINGMARTKRHLYLPFIRIEKGEGLSGVQIWSVNSRRGKVEWTRKFEGAMGFVAGDDNGPVYVADTGMVLGLTADRGEIRWKTRIKGRVVSPPLLRKGKLYVVAERRKAGWQGLSLYVLDIEKGKLRGELKINAKRASYFIYRKAFTLVSDQGDVLSIDENAKIKEKISVTFDDTPNNISATVSGNRVYIFSYHQDGNGYVYLVDMDKKRLLAKANALDAPARSVIPWGRTIFLDGADGNIHAFRLDRSARPLRKRVPASEYAKELIQHAIKNAHSPQPGLTRKLTGLGPKALASMHDGLRSKNPYVVAATAKAVARLKKRSSVSALLDAAKIQKTKKAKDIDALVPVIDAIATIRDGRAVSELTKILDDENQSHSRRRAAYVALGAIGTPAALQPIWKLRAAKALNTMNWNPIAETITNTYEVEADVDPSKKDEALVKETKLSSNYKAGDKNEYFALSLSPYLGGYNDVWLSECDEKGKLIRSYFTALTKAEIKPNKRIRFVQLKINKAPIKKQNVQKDTKKSDASKGDKTQKDSKAPIVETHDMKLAKLQAELIIQMLSGKKWIKSRPVKIEFSSLMKDIDKDGLPDIVERRLQTCVTHHDCDGDGIKDSEDVNPLASGKQKLAPEQKVYREAFFAYFAFMKRRGLVVLDPGNGPSYEVYGRQDPVLSLRHNAVSKLRKEIGLHAVDYVSFGGPYPEGGASRDALKTIEWSKNKRSVKIGMDIIRSGDNAVGYNVSLKKIGRNWVVTDIKRAWTTNLKRSGNVKSKVKIAPAAPIKRSRLIKAAPKKEEAPAKKETKKAPAKKKAVKTAVEKKASVVKKTAKKAVKKTAKTKTPTKAAGKAK